MTPLARTAGSMLAFTSLALAFAAAAQGQVAAAPSGGGAMPWVFAAFVGLAIVAIFVFVLYLVRGPTARSPGSPPPGHR
jgi:hypothetical protein